VPIMQELRLSHTQFGMLGSAFFLLFFVSGVTVGFLANRFSGKIIMAIMGAVWSATMLPLSVTASFPLLIGSRVVLGAAEGPAFPVAVHAVHKWFLDARRALPTSIVASGAAFGAGIVAPGIIWIIDRFSWHAAFGTLGVIGLIWLSCWLVFMQEGPSALSELKSEPQSRIPYRYLLTSRTTVGFYLSGFAAYWIISLNLVWLPNYLIKGLGIEPARAAWIIALPSVMQILLAPGIAHASQKLMTPAESWEACASSLPACRWPRFLLSRRHTLRYFSWDWRAPLAA
jgi:ACS family D-galactonate transporter-like MFS transporter